MAIRKGLRELSEKLDTIGQCVLSVFSVAKVIGISFDWSLTLQGVLTSTLKYQLRESLTFSMFECGDVV